MTLTNVELEAKATNSEKDVKGLLKKRYIQGFMMFSLFFVGVFLNLSMSVAILGTRDKSAYRDSEELEWDIKTKSRVLTWFFWGYVVMQFPAGLLGQAFSVKSLLLKANVCCAVLALLTPLVATKGGWFLVCLIRFLQGLCQGFYMPLAYALTSKWVPLQERNRFVGYALNGQTVGVAGSLVLLNLLANSSRGWPSVFYVSGALGLVWSALWWWVGAESPFTHPTISDQERDYIQASLSTSANTQKYSMPWKGIFSSIPVWVLAGMAVTKGWTSAMIVNQLPGYTREKGHMTVLPYLSLWLFSFPVCWMADVLIKRRILSTEAIRKLYTAVFLGGGALIVLSLCLVERLTTVSTTLVTIAFIFKAFMYSGFNINHLDLSPNFAGVLIGLCTSLESLSGFLAQIYIAWFGYDFRAVIRWPYLFVITSLVCLVGTTIYLILGSADVQPWNTPSTVSKETETTESNTKL